MRKPFNKANDVKILSDEYVYQGFYQLKKYKLQFRFFEGSWSSPIDRELFYRRPFVAALPYDPQRDEVILIEQFRVGLIDQPKPWSLEIVAGIVEDNSRSAAENINREMQEEAGLSIHKLHQLYEYFVSPGGSNEYLTLYCAKVDTSHAGGIYGLKAESEDILVHVLKTQDAFNLLESGAINNGITITALQWLQLHKKELDALWV